MRLIIGGMAIVALGSVTYSSIVIIIRLIREAST